MYDFIKEEWPTARTNEPVNMGSFVTLAVSTSLRSSVLLLSVGLNSMFTRNTFSKNVLHPWLLYQDTEQNEALARHITKKWQEMVVPNGQRQRVNTIAKHIVYDFTDDTKLPEMRPLKCDDNANVRVHVEDLQIWSHPRRDEPLTRVLEGTRGFTQARGYFRETYPQSIKDIIENDKIKNKEERLTTVKNKCKEKFDKFYSDYYCKLEAEKRIPTSYEFPTLQLALETGVGQPSQRYGDTFSGCYSAKDNEVHQKFPVDDKLPKRPLPTKEEVFEELMKLAEVVCKDVRQDQ